MVTLRLHHLPKLALRDSHGRLGMVKSCAARLLERGSLTSIPIDDGKILTGKPDQFDGKNPWVSG